MSRTLVIGGGIVGTATAWRLAANGAGVELIDRRDPGRATAAGAGISYAPPISRTDDAGLRLAGRANSRYPALATELRDQLDTADVGITRRPVYKIALPGETEALDRAWDWLTAAVTECAAFDSTDVERVGAGEIADRFPGLTDTVGGVRFNTGLRIDGREVTQSMRRAAIAAGAVLREDDVRRIRVADGRVEGVVTADRGTVATDRVVVTGGAWSGAFGADLDTQLPVSPQRGQILHLDDAPAGSADWPMVSTFSGTYLVPWEAGHVAVGATHEDAGFDARPTVAGVGDLLSRAMELVPSLRKATFTEARVGLRPLSADGRPIIGPVGTVDGCYVATGHGGGGLQRGPISGRLMATLLTGGHPELSLEPFAPDRFD